VRPIKSLARHTRPAWPGAVALCATAALAVAGCGSGSSSSASSSSAAPASLTVWPMGASTPGSNKPEFVPGMLANDTQNGSV
jgi:hypothetical protein